MCGNYRSYLYPHLGVYQIDFMQQIYLWCKFTRDGKLQTNLDNSIPVTYKQEVKWIVKKPQSLTELQYIVYAKIKISENKGGGNKATSTYPGSIPLSLVPRDFS